MDSQVILNIVTICISTILSVGAIALSIWFYMKSNEQNRETALMQTEIRNAIQKLEQLYNRTYTDTFGALKTQLHAMQNHIFTSSVGDTETGEPSHLRFIILGCISERNTLSLDELCKEAKGYDQAEVEKLVYAFQREGVIKFDGQKINFLQRIEETSGSGSGS